MKVSLIRHTSVVVDGNLTCYGNSDVAVRDSFPAEAEQLKQEIATLSPSAVFSSPLTRARMLAEYCGYPAATLDDRLREMHFGEWEMRPWSEILDTDDIPAFFDYYITNAVPGGESLAQQQARVKAFLDEQQSAGQSHIMLFCHGGVINCALSLINNIPLREAFSYLPPFASHTLVTY